MEEYTLYDSADGDPSHAGPGGENAKSAGLGLGLDDATWASLRSSPTSAATGRNSSAVSSQPTSTEQRSPMPHPAQVYHPLGPLGTVHTVYCSQCSAYSKLMGHG